LNNWFSAISYYKIVSIKDKDNCIVSEKRDSSTELTMARDIIETEMHSGLVFEKEEKMTRTGVLEQMMSAGEAVMTVNFNKKVDDTHIKSILDSADKKPDFGKLSKAMMAGKQVEMSCYLSKSENNLGRSNVIDLNAPHG
jgi:hypothetical protein